MKLDVRMGQRRLWKDSKPQPNQNPLQYFKVKLKKYPRTSNRQITIKKTIEFDKYNHQCIFAYWYYNASLQPLMNIIHVHKCPYKENKAVLSWWLGDNVTQSNTLSSFLINTGSLTRLIIKHSQNLHAK